MLFILPIERERELQRKRKRKLEREREEKKRERKKKERGLSSGTLPLIAFFTVYTTYKYIYTYKYI